MSPLVKNDLDHQDERLKGPALAFYEHVIALNKVVEKQSATATDAEDKQVYADYLVHCKTAQNILHKMYPDEVPQPEGGDNFNRPQNIQQVAYALNYFVNEVHMLEAHLTRPRSVMLTEDTEYRQKRTALYDKGRDFMEALIASDIHVKDLEAHGLHALVLTLTHDTKSPWSRGDRR